MRRRSAIVFGLLGALACVEIPPVVTEPATGPATQSSVEPAPVDAQPDIEGSGWRVRGGVFESVHEGVRIQLPSGWRLAAARDFELVGFGLFNEEHGIKLAISHGSFMSRDTELLRRELAKSFLSRGDETAPSMSAVLDGQRLQFSASRDANWEYLHGLIVHSGHPLEIVLVYPSHSNSELMRERVRSLLAAFELLSPAERAGLRAEFDRIPSRRDLLATDRSLRGATFHDFAFGVRINIPSNILEATIDPEHDDDDMKIRIVLEDRSRDLYASLLATDLPYDMPVTAQEWHEHMVAQLCEQWNVHRRDLAKVQKFGEADALVTTLVNPDIGLLFRVATVADDHRGLAFVVRKFSAIYDALDGVDETLAAFEVVAGLERARMEGSRYVDAQAGYSIDGLLARDAETEFPESPGVFVSATHWPTEDGAIAVVAYNFTRAEDSVPSVLREIEELVALDPTLVSPTWIELSKPVPGQRSTWADGDFEHTVAKFQRERTLYMVHVTSTTVGKYEEVLAGFELLP